MNVMRCIKNLFVRFFDIRPKNQDDYYVFLRWSVSRKLAWAVAAVISVFCLSLIWSSKPDKLHGENAVKSYKYNSLSLKFVTGKVRILGKSGYTAYVGDVERGIVKGKGTLYGIQGNVVYEGDFDANAYNGTGKYYSDNAQLVYEGAFQNNRYCGAGKLYRENGMLWYEGNFNQGFMEGEGTLYDTAQQQIYSGSFRHDRILYQELIGRSTSEIAAKYNGAKEIYMGEDTYCVYMKDIDAIYFGADRSNTLEGTFLVSGVYVLQTDICLNGELLSDIAQLHGFFGSPVYEGNTFLDAEDEIALNTMCGLTGSDVLYGKAGYQVNSVYDDVKEVSGFDREYQAYIYVYESEGVLYTFFCKDKEKGFDFYRIE
ncbi:MAG: hypothetical protein K2N73_11080 [Lachnospiraceae bacterium]|nr:hypothetical protein [Lachnospiraceae bacterium]